MSSRRRSRRRSPRVDIAALSHATSGLTRSSARGRELLVALYDAAVTGAAPGPVTAAALREFQARPDQRLWLYALGKAAHPMASAAASALQRSLHTIAGGAIAPPELSPSPYTTVPPPPRVPAPPRPTSL